MKKRNLITICSMIIFICGSFAYKTETSRAQKKDVNKPGSTPAKTATPTPNRNSSSTTNNSTDSSGKKKIIVVLDFDNASPQCRDEIYGKNVALQLSAAFTNSGEYTVIERQRLEKIFEEIDVSQGERFLPETAAKVGKILSASTVVLGTIMQCSPDTKLINAFIGQSIRHTVKVGLSIRLVNINSAEIQNAVNISESETDTSLCVKGFCSATVINSDLQIKLFNKAVEKAVKKTVTRLSSIIEGKEKPISKEPIPSPTPNPTPTGKVTPQTPQTPTNSMAKIVAVNGTTIYITGLGNSIKVGDIVSILRGKEIKNAMTGEIIDFDGKEIAKAEIIEVNENTVKAKIIKGLGVKELDFVKLLR